MSAVYTQEVFNALVTSSVEKVAIWFTNNQGKGLEACASALGVPYEVVYQAVLNAGLVVLPNASGELHWNQKGK